MSTCNGVHLYDVVRLQRLSRIDSRYIWMTLLYVYPSFYTTVTTTTVPSQRPMALAVLRALYVDDSIRSLLTFRCPQLARRRRYGVVRPRRTLVAAGTKAAVNGDNVPTVADTRRRSAEIPASVVVSRCCGNMARASCTDGRCL